jgi:hypothetical protein
MIDRIRNNVGGSTSALDRNKYAIEHITTLLSVKK